MCNYGGESDLELSVRFGVGVPLRMHRFATKYSGSWGKGSLDVTIRDLLPLQWFLLGENKKWIPNVVAN